MNASLTQNTRRLALALAASSLLMAAGCSQEPAGIGNEPSEAAREVALEKAAEALQVDHAMDAAQFVEDLTGGVTVGMADEAAGLDMELGAELPNLDSVAPYTMGSRLAMAARTSRRDDLRFHMQKAGDPQPGDVLYEETRTNLDGSVSTLRVIQDAPLSVVKVEEITDWPNGHLLLDETRDEIVVDRGADLNNEVDDVLFSLLSELRFNSGASLTRSIDERADGGIQTDSRVDVLSNFRARPNHPRLIEIATSFVVDVHQLDGESDDRFVSAERLTRFRGNAHVGGSPRVVEALAPSSPVAEGEEACGGSASRYIAFAPWSRLVDWNDQASLSCDGSGMLSRAINYADGTSADATIRESAEGIVTLELNDREGIHTTGSFDENAGTFAVQTQFPSGYDPVLRSIDGQSNADGTDWSLNEQIEYADAFVERNHLEGRETASSKELAGSHAGRDETVEFELSSNLDETQYQGWIRNDRDESLEFAVEILSDLSRIVDFEAQNATTRVVGHLVIDVDGCGTGTIHVYEAGNHASIEVEFCDEQLSDDAGNTLNL
jgi:hypothetical protein